MQMPLERLLGFPTPIVISVDWVSIEEELGSKLPDDYKAFVSRYGAGAIDSFLTILTPAGPTKWADLVWRSQEHDEFSQRREQHPPFDAFPAPGGLLAFGQTDNGDVLYWRTNGAPEQWTVLVYEGRGFEYFEFPGSMTSFLEKILSRTLRVNVFPDDFPSDAPWFAPH